jgi:hypothetical protein
MRYFLILVASMFFQSCFFMGGSPAARLRKAKEAGPIDVAIVPGLPLYHGRWDTLLKARILWSEFLYRKGYVRNILYSGSAVYTPWIESTSMALIASQLGIAKDHFLIDTLAEHSTENLYFGYQLAREKGFKTIAVATDPFQCAMLYRFSKKNFEKEICYLPIIYDSIQARTGLDLTIDTILTLRKNFIPIHERESYRSRLKGTRGKKIKAK